MSASRFVKPETSVLKISNGDTITVRRRLTSGEERARFARMSLAGVDGALQVNRLQIGLATITAYLLDWTVKDDDGRIVPIEGLDPEAMASVIDGLDVPSFTEIREAIEAHEATQVERKNGPDGESKQ